MAAVKKLITMAKEEGLFKIAQVLESAYVDDCNSSMACIEELEEVKLYGAYICRRALIESDGDPLKEIIGDTRKLFLQYIYQVKMMEEVTFARNLSNLKRSESDILIMCTDAGHNASMMIFYLAKEVNDGLELDFVFSIGNLNNEDGIIPRNELDIIDKGKTS